MDQELEKTINMNLPKAPFCQAKKNKPQAVHLIISKHDVKVALSQTPAAKKEEVFKEIYIKIYISEMPQAQITQIVHVHKAILHLS